MSRVVTSVVTGAAGRIGRGVAAALRGVGHRVVGVDVLPPPDDLVNCDAYFVCDLAAAADVKDANHQSLQAACSGADVVVHCAAWPGPSSTPPAAVVASGSAVKRPGIGLEPTAPSVLLRDNVGATSAVCEAAIGGGASRVVFSSSAFAIGYSHAAAGAQAFAPRYLPIDESHGAMPHESYGLSKLAGEGVLEAAARTARTTSFVSLRFPNIIKSENWHTLPWDPPTEASPLTLLLWCYVHEADVINAHVAAATRPDAAAAGSQEAYIIAAPDTRFAQPTLELMNDVLGLRGVPTRTTPSSDAFAGNASPLSSAKAAARLGWAPRSWQEPSTPQPTATAPLVPAYGLGATAAHRARSDPALQHFDLGGFELASGDLLPAGATLAYKLHGRPIGEGRGVILHPTSFDAVHDELEYNIGPGRTLDTDRYSVIVTNLLGNGVSYSPSIDVMGATNNGTAPGGPLPPPIFVSIADNVAAQKTLMRHLGVSCDASAPLSLVYGYSMGALQAYEWAVSSPEGVERIAAVCGASRCGSLNRIFLRSLEAALKADGAWDEAGQRFTHRPMRGLRAFSSIYAGWGVGSSFYVDKAYEGAGFSSADDFLERSYIPAFASCDGDDLLAQIHAWREADATRGAADLTAALGAVRAKVLLMPCDTDKYFTLEEASAEAAALGDRCLLKPIVSPAGHRAGDPHRPELSAELEFVRTAVHEFLG